jgi:hypothetical protein
MHSSASELSEAVVLFIGFGSASAPCGDYERLIQRFGAPRGAALQSQVESLLLELDTVKVDWSKHSLASSGELVYTEMHARHPELSDTAPRALAWNFMFYSR